MDAGRWGIRGEKGPMWNPIQQTVCRDCGARLDAFGICPNARAELAFTATAPVYCGVPRPRHPMACTCERCQWASSPLHVAPFN